MSLLTAFLNIAFRLLELSVRILIQLLGFVFTLLGKVIAAAIASRSMNNREGRHQPPSYPSSNTRSKKWQKVSRRRRL